MPENNEPEIQKRYYSIGEVAEQLGVATSLIRFWESHFDTIKPRKNKNGARQYTLKDIEDIKLVYHLVREKGFTLAGAKDALKNERQIREQQKALVALKQARSFLSDLKKQLDQEHN